MSSENCHQVAVLALPAVVAFDLAIPCQVFGHRDEAGRYAVTVCARDDDPVPTTTGMDVVVPGRLADLRRADTIVVPGFVAEQALDDATLGALVDARARGARIVSICTGAFALAQAGLLDGRRAATHWRDAARLQAEHPSVDVDGDALFVAQDGGRLWTSAGVAAGIDLCLHLVRQDHGAASANMIARRMVVAPLRDGGQSQFAERPVPVSASDPLAATRAWMLEHLGEPLSVARIAAHAGHSPRSLHRHFVAQTGCTPLQWLLGQRVHAARALLEETSLGVDEVAARAGFGSAAALRTHLRRALGTTPTGYRGTWLARETLG